MRNCDYYERLIGDMIDGELDSQQSAELRTHMETCESCRRMYQAFSAISAVVSENMEEPPEDFAKTVMNKISSPREKAKRPFAWGRYAAMAACFVLVVFGASRLLNFGMGGSTKQSQPMEAGKSEPGQLTETTATSNVGEVEAAPEAPAKAENEENTYAGDFTLSAGNGSSDESIEKFGRSLDITWDLGDGDTIIDYKAAGIPIEFTANNATATGGSFDIRNQDSASWTYGDEYAIQVADSLNWYYIDILPEWTTDGQVIAPDETVTVQLDWTEHYGELPPGSYRVIKNFVPENDENSAEGFFAACEFEVEN